MLPVVMRVENLETKSTVQHVFRRSPVHIGRNKLNELPLADGFVSLWHGILRFGENTLEYLDLDSTNGTEVDGHQVRRNVFVPVTEQTDLRIGSLRLHLSRSEAVTAEPKSDLTLFGQRTIDLAFQRSGPESPASQPTSSVVFKPKAGRTPVSLAIARALPDEQSPGAVAGSLFPLYENYRQAWRTLHAQLTGKLAQLPDEKRAATLQFLRQRFPALEQEAQFQALRAAPAATPLAVVPPEVMTPEGATPDATGEEAEDGQEITLPDSLSATLVQPGPLQSMPAGASPARVTLLGPQRATHPPTEGGFLRARDQTDPSTALLRLFAQTYASESAELPSAQDVERFLNQLAAVLEAFGKAFLELRRGHDQFGREIAVPMIGDRTPLRHAKTPRDLLRYLLDCNGQGTDRIRSLTEGFAEVMIHQVALLNGIRQGIGALLSYLSPDELQRSSALARNGAGTMLLKAWPVRAMALWGPYVARHQELLQGERAVQSVVFGSEFAFAYAQIVGGNVTPPPGKTARANGGPGRRADG